MSSVSEREFSLRRNRFQVDQAHPNQTGSHIVTAQNRHHPNAPRANRDELIETNFSCARLLRSASADFFLLLFLLSIQSGRRSPVRDAVVLDLEEQIERNSRSLKLDGKIRTATQPAVACKSCQFRLLWGGLPIYRCLLLTKPSLVQTGGCGGLAHCAHFPFLLAKHSDLTPNADPSTSLSEARPLVMMMMKAGYFFSCCFPQLCACVCPSKFQTSG